MAEVTVVLSDLQGYKIDRRAWRAALKFIADFKPDRVVLAGDIVEFDAISNYRRTPGTRARLDKECKFVRERILEPLGRAVGPPARSLASIVRPIFYLEGNHEDRLYRYLCDRAPELYGSMQTVSQLLRLDDFGITWLGKRPFRINRHLIVTHGHCIRKWSAQTAKAMMNEYKCSGISGHTHRMGVYYERGMGREWMWVENGHMEDVAQAKWVPGIANWQQGFSVVYNHGRQGFHIEQAKILKGKVMYGGKVWSL